jgi:predicted nucleic acid-binding Zn finger protein
MTTSTSPRAQYISLGACLADLVAAVAARHPELAPRLTKAAELVNVNTARKVFPDNPETGDYFVQSACNPSVVYSVNLVAGVCTCKNFVNRGGPCAHLLAVKLLKASSNLRNARQRAVDYGQPLPTDYVPLLAGLVA